jgi:transposase
MQRRKFSREFKLGAVRLIVYRGVAVVQAARDLDFHRTCCVNWWASYRGIRSMRFPATGR